jgi:putative transposase
MPQSFSCVFLHVVFSTKDRRPFIADPHLRALAHQYLGGTSKGLGCVPILVGGVEDHVHILTSLSRTLTIADYVQKLKNASNTWMKSQGVADFKWQSGYGAFSVSPDGVPGVRAYIENQEAHHRVQDFQEEFRALLREHGLTWDEKYVWD